MGVARILYVEDSLEYGTLLRLVLERDFGKELDLTWVTSRNSFVSILSEGENFDFVICDGHIPGWCDPYEEVHAAYPLLPIVFHTSSADSKVELMRGVLAFSKTSEGRKSLILYLRHVLNNFLGDDNGVARQHNELLEEVLATQRKGSGGGYQVDRSS